MSLPAIKISVIIPVYNVEKYLCECVDSVLNQNYTNLEIILVNDGSPDNSGQICDEYALKDERVKVFHQENKGLPGARNTGLKHVTGDYISFIDSDDSINQGMYLDIVNSIEKAEITIDVAYLSYSTTKKIIEKAIYTKADIKKKFLPQFLGTSQISIGRMASVWSLCIRQEIIKDLLFYNIASIEDKPFFIETMLRANSVMIIPKQYYNYRENLDSLSRNYHKGFINGMTVGHQVITEMLKKYANEHKELAYLNDNSIVIFYYHSIKNELKNNELQDNINLVKRNIKEYYINNNLDSLLTWKRTFRLSQRNPKWLLLKLGYTDKVIQMLHKKQQRKLSRAIN